MIPFNPQPLAELKARFTQALVDSYSVEKILADAALRPGSKPQHVFDCEDGLRLIVSRDRLQGKEVIHFSASVDRARYRGRFDKSLMKLMVRRFAELSGFAETPTFVRFSDEGIPHWIIVFSTLN